MPIPPIIRKFTINTLAAKITSSFVFRVVIHIAMHRNEVVQVTMSIITNTLLYAQYRVTNPAIVIAVKAMTDVL